MSQPRLHGSHLPNSCVQASSISLVLNKPQEHGFTDSPIFSSGLAFVHLNLITLCSYIIINYDGLDIFTLVYINASFILTRNKPHRENPNLLSRTIDPCITFWVLRPLISLLAFIYHRVSISLPFLTALVWTITN